VGCGLRFVVTAAQKKIATNLRKYVRVCESARTAQTYECDVNQPALCFHLNSLTFVCVTCQEYYVLTAGSLCPAAAAGRNISRESLMLIMQIIHDGRREKKTRQPRGFWLVAKKGDSAPLDPNLEGCCTRVVKGAHMHPEIFSAAAAATQVWREKSPAGATTLLRTTCEMLAAIMPPDKDIIAHRHHFAYHIRGMR
jgi:hypothetical protein